MKTHPFVGYRELFLLKTRNTFAILFPLVICTCVMEKTFGQDPGLPATNLGLTNMLDAVPPGPGLFYMNHMQVYKTTSMRDARGSTLLTDLKVNSLLVMHQLAFISKTKVLGGNLGFTALLPIVKISATNSTGSVPSVNPGVFGDFIMGPVIQWFDKKLLNKALFHRAEIDFVFPTGSYSSNDAINPSAHLFTISAHYTFTYFLTKKFSVSARNHINYNTKILDSEIRPGIFASMNYSIEHTIYKALRAEIAGYYLKQLTQDSFKGDSRYYQTTYGITDTREQVFAYGLGLNYITPTGLFMEAKVFFETAAKNRSEGTRPTLRLVYKF
ncbi:SphA family protein [Chryseolinea soli]|uniref:Transporter n=1 Tax=Chryseolinea soli TaxID=2321403 RepID=A0A385SP63_9BACT|nr:transporter [Chryseolinea soli]AYB32067.1 hypothetical protein D4L85_16480 [Chryseolinea soli]